MNLLIIVIIHDVKFVSRTLQNQQFFFLTKKSIKVLEIQQFIEQSFKIEINVDSNWTRLQIYQLANNSRFDSMYFELVD